MEEKNNETSSAPPTPSSSEQNSPIGSPSTAPAMHRSRKEKLVVRSFSTETNDSMEPRILTREEFLRQNKKRRSRDGSLSAPNSPKGSRDSSPIQSPTKEESSTSTAAVKVEGSVGKSLKMRGPYKKKDPTAKKYNKKSEKQNPSSSSPSSALKRMFPQPKLGRPRKYNVSENNATNRERPTFIKSTFFKSTLTKARATPAKRPNLRIPLGVTPPAAQRERKLVKYRLPSDVERRVCGKFSPLVSDPSFPPPPPLKKAKLLPSSENNIQLLSKSLAEEEEDLEKLQNDALLYSYGLARLQEIVKGLSTDGITLSQFCEQAIKRLRMVGVGVGKPDKEQDWSTIKFPRIKQEELQLLKNLLEPDENFECFDDELELAKLYIHLMKYELNSYRVKKGSACSRSYYSTMKRPPTPQPEEISYFKIQVNPELEGKLPQRDDYSERVEANIQRLKDGGRDYEYESSSEEEVGVGRITTNGGSIEESNGSLSSSHHHHPSMSPTSSITLSVGSSSNNSFPSTPTSSPTKRKKCVPYSRQTHSTVFPPYENNHCSYTQHHCPFPRAPSSRFCLHHIGEGATLTFERCKYVKGPRECGRFIPKSQGQIIFCDFHAALVANARRRKMKPLKAPGDAVPFLISHLALNNDRMKGAIMEKRKEGGGGGGSSSYTLREDILRDEYNTLNDSSSSSDSEDDLALRGKLGDEDTDVDDYDDNEDNHYDCLGNAGYYTVEEVVKMYSEKLRQKKRLLARCCEIQKLKYKHEFRGYSRGIRRLRREAAPFTTDPKQISTSPSIPQSFIDEQLKVYCRTKAVMSHKRVLRSPRSLLRREILRRRAELGLPPRSKEERKIRQKLLKPSLTCVYGSGGAAGNVRCDGRAMPLTRFCRHHILEDRNQRLFKKCSFPFGPDPDDICQNVCYTEIEKFGCPLHSLPILPKEAGSSRPNVEELLERTLGSDGSDEEEYVDETLLEEMEELVGDEVVGLEHWRDSVRSIYAKGLYNTDSEESDDTEDEDGDVVGGALPPPPTTAFDPVTLPTTITTSPPPIILQ